MASFARNVLDKMALRENVKKITLAKIYKCQIQDLI